MYLKKTLVLTVFIMFGLVATYIPQPHNNHQNIPTADALLGGGIVFDPTNMVQNTVTAVASGSLWTKEFVLDGILWALAKAIVSSMISSTINWINSGFEGSPAFVQDLDGFLLEVADITAGAFIERLGGDWSFLCSPFELDIRVALVFEYEVAREGKPYEGCRLSDVIDNVDNFTDFIGGNFSSGGWASWFDVTMNPKMYTPYGQLLEARSALRAELITAEGIERQTLDFGDGFLSSKVCTPVDTPDGPSENCVISLPGQTIAQQLSDKLNLGDQTLVNADEFNELIAALLGQLATKAITGASGLLGLSPNTGHTYSGFNGGSYLSQMQQEANQQSNSNVGNPVPDMQETLSILRNYRNLANQYATRFSQYRYSQDDDKRNLANVAYDDTQRVLRKIDEDIPILEAFIRDYQTLENRYAATTDQAEQQQIRNQQSQLVANYSAQGFYSQDEYNASNTNWRSTYNALQQ